VSGAGLSSPVVVKLVDAAIRPTAPPPPPPFVPQPAPPPAVGATVPTPPSPPLADAPVPPIALATVATASAPAVPEPEPVKPLPPPPPPFAAITPAFAIAGACSTIAPPEPPPAAELTSPAPQSVPPAPPPPPIAPPTAIVIRAAAEICSAPPQRADVQHRELAAAAELRADVEAVCGGERDADRRRAGVDGDAAYELQQRAAREAVARCEVQRPAAPVAVGIRRIGRGRRRQGERATRPNDARDDGESPHEIIVQRKCLLDHLNDLTV